MEKKDKILNFFIIVLGILIGILIACFVLLHTKTIYVQKQKTYIHEEIRNICESICNENYYTISKDDFQKKLEENDIKYNSIIYKKDEEEYVLGIQYSVLGKNYDEIQYIKIDYS